MRLQKHIIRIVWTSKGVKKFEDEVNNWLAKGWELHGVEVHRGPLRIICMCIMSEPVDKCDCDCPCCIEIHQGHCDCECDCCLQHAHRDGSYHKDEDDE